MILDETSVSAEYQALRQALARDLQPYGQILEASGYNRQRAERHPDFKRVARGVEQAEVHRVPPPLRAQLRTLSSGACRLCQLNEIGRHLLTDGIARERAARLQGRDVPALGPDLGGGRLLGFAPDGSLCCGTAEYVTYGFFDEENAPAWDLWLCYHEGCLLSWIPKGLRLVAEGVRANPEECLFWVGG